VKQKGAGQKLSSQRGCPPPATALTRSPPELNGDGAGPVVVAERIEIDSPVGAIAGAATTEIGDLPIPFSDNLLLGNLHLEALSVPMEALKEDHPVNSNQDYSQINN
jgi:hypothetical protein